MNPAIFNNRSNNKQTEQRWNEIEIRYWRIKRVSSVILDGRYGCEAYKKGELKLELERKTTMIKRQISGIVQALAWKLLFHASQCYEFLYYFQCFDTHFHINVRACVHCGIKLYYNFQHQLIQIMYPAYGRGCANNMRVCTFMKVESILEFTI